MNYALIQDQTVAEYPLTQQQIQARFPNTSFAIPFTPPEGYVKVKAVGQPDATPFQNILEGDPELVDGLYCQTWQLEPATDMQIAERMMQQAAEVRQQRNEKLTASDWTQFADVFLEPDMRNAWRLYREALRMVPQQEGFPWEVQWPVEPT